jgi:hypothetical protein
MRKRLNLLLHVTTSSTGLRRVWILVFADRAPHRWNLHRRRPYQHERQHGEKHGGHVNSKAGRWQDGVVLNRRKRKGSGMKIKETDEVIRRCFTISYETRACFAYAYTWSTKILAQALVVLEEASKLQL